MKKHQNQSFRNYSSESVRENFSPEHCTPLMSKIKSKGTQFEQLFIELFEFSIDIPFTPNGSDIKGKTDIIRFSSP